MISLLGIVTRRLRFGLRIKPTTLIRFNSSLVLRQSLKLGIELENLLGGRFGEFSTLDNFNKASFILGFENWNRDDFKALLKLVKSFVLLIWETRKKELYGDQDCVVSGCSCSCPLTGGLTSSACVCGCVVNGVSATAAT